MPNLFIHNANMLSFHDGFVNGKADALLIRGNRIDAVGKKEELEAAIDSATEIIDAGGKTLLPGFNDSHIHVWKVGNLKTFMLDLRGVASLDELQERLSHFAREYPETPWITARGFNEALWKEKLIPTKADIDKVIADRPVYMIRTCAHIAVANSKAIEISGITPGTKAPPGGLINHDEHGQPNGIFSETALGLITQHIPAYTQAELKTMVLAARQELYRYGITAVTDPAVDPVLMETYQEMNRAGCIGMRLNAVPILLPDGGATPYTLPELYSSDFLTVNMVKFFSDGGLSGKTAALKRPYKDSNDRGISRLEQPQFDELTRMAMQKGFGIATHSIGDAAIDFVIDQYKKLEKDFPGIIKRVEHLGLPDEKNLMDMASHHIATSMQAIFISELGRNFRNYLDEGYLSHCYPIRSVLDHKILMALSSDAPVVSNFNPFKGMQAAVTRRDDDGFLISVQEGITVEQALKAYTIDAARISGANHFGALQKDMLADFIIVDKNPLTSDPGALSDLKVEKTFVDGECIWQNND